MSTQGRPSIRAHRKSTGGRKSQVGVVDGFDDPFAGSSTAVRVTVDHINSLDDADRMQSKSWLVFHSSDLEQKFRLTLVQPLCQNMNLACVFLIIYSAYSMYGSVFASDIVLVEHWDTSANRAYNMCWFITFIASASLYLATRKSRAFRSSLKTESTICWTFAIILILRCFLGNRWRCAKLFGQDPIETFGAVSSDTELLLKSAAAIVYLGVYAHVRFKMLLVPGISAGLSYPLSTAIAGSPNGDGAINTMTLIFMISLIFAGQRRIEASGRKSFLVESENEAKIRALELEKEHAEDTHRRLAEEDLLRQQHLRATEELSAFGCPLIDFTGIEEANTASSQQMRQTTCEDQYPVMDRQAVDATPNKQLAAALNGKNTNWARLDQVVHRIRDKNYTLKEFHFDCLACFPELSLLQLETNKAQERKTGLLDSFTHGRDQASTGDGFTSKSQRSGAADAKGSPAEQMSNEILRTHGSLYAIFWLLRLDMDGKQGLCFGLDETKWELLSIPKADSEESMVIADKLKEKVFFSMSPEEKQLNFYHNFGWELCQDLFINAGLLNRESDGSLKVSLERVRSLLVLTAINRIFVNKSLLPRRRQADGADGEEIQNHSVALEYVLAKFPDLLPSFSGLSPEEQKVVSFTQGQKTGFHSGWLVQGEAPPAALFKAFRKVIREDGVQEEDVAFYFAYWLTQLAGQEPTPKQGAEKIVKMLPESALSAFVRAFEHVCRLATQTETEVLQGYLQSQWLQASLGPIPEGALGICLMRLSLQAQKHAPKVHGVFDRLPKQDQQILCQEMARTGIAGQNYETTKLTSHHSILVIHAAAMLQKSGGYDLAGGLQILAEIYRQGRKLWPLLDENGKDSAAVEKESTAMSNIFQALEEEDEEGSKSRTSKFKVDKEYVQDDEPAGAHTAKIRIDQIKDLLPYEMRRAGLKRNLSEVEGWFLVKTSDTEAVVEKHLMGICDTFNKNQVQYRWLVL